MRFAQIIHRSSPTLNAIYRHRFNRELITGELASERFYFFLEQDYLYLRDFSTALQQVSLRCEEESHQQVFSQLSLDILQTERKLHLNYLKDRPNHSFFSARREKIPAIADYTAHLLCQTNTAPLREAIAGLIPCYFIYRELGEQMNQSSQANPNNPYQAWLTSYSSKRFVGSTEKIIAIAEELNEQISCSRQQEAIYTAFHYSATCELRLLDEVYSLGEKIVKPSQKESSWSFH